MQYQRAIPLLEARLKLQPKRTRWHAELGWVYARLGRDAQALQQGQRVLKTPATRVVIKQSPWRALVLARIVAQVCKTGDAVAVLGTLLVQPTGWTVSVPMLKMNPTWDPIRQDPRFQALLKKYAQHPPAVIPAPPRS